MPVAPAFERFIASNEEVRRPDATNEPFSIIRFPRPFVDWVDERLQVRRFKEAGKFSLVLNQFINERSKMAKPESCLTQKPRSALKWVTLAALCTTAFFAVVVFPPRDAEDNGVAREADQQLKIVARTDPEFPGSASFTKHTQSAKSGLLKGENLHDEVQGVIDSKGPEKAANILRDRYRATPAIQRQAIELVASTWAELAPRETWKWIADNLVENESSVTEEEKTKLWRAAVSGYIGGAVVSDPESAAGAAELLEPTTDATDDKILREYPGDPGRPKDPDFLTKER
ncbi:MAG: hypothetical protein ACSHYF_10420 [Verrucomicrobiaceae bacterium]